VPDGTVMVKNVVIGHVQWWSAESRNWQGSGAIGSRL